MYRFILFFHSTNIRSNHSWTPHTPFLPTLPTTCSFNDFSRWDEVAESVRVIAGLADAAKAPTEIRFLNNAQPIVIGTAEDKGDELERVTTQLAVEPHGQTPICAQLLEVITQVKGMENELRSSQKVALLVIMTDGESSDGSIIETLKALEGLPVQVIVRISTEEKEVVDYWQNINSELDLDIYVLEGYEWEANLVQNKNSWLTYGEPLHQIRAFGIAVPGVNTLSYRQLNKENIKGICELLL